MMLKTYLDGGLIFLEAKETTQVMNFVSMVPI